VIKKLAVLGVFYQKVTQAHPIVSVRCHSSATLGSMLIATYMAQSRQ